jgi:hypothetical protein
VKPHDRRERLGQIQLQVTDLNLILDNLKYNGDKENISTLNYLCDNLIYNIQSDMRRLARELQDGS